MGELELHKSAVDPFTGEIYEIDRPLPELAAWLERRDEVDREWRAFKDWLNRAVYERLAQENTMTLRFSGGLTLKGSKPKESRRYDQAKAIAVIERFCAEGKMTQTARERMTKEVVADGELKKFERNNPEFAEAIRGTYSVTFSAPSARVE